MRWARVVMGWACVLSASLAAGAQPLPRWIGTWAAAPQAEPAPVRYERQTLRLIVHTSAAGDQLRVRLCNVYGDAPLVLGAAHVARREIGANVDPSSDRALRFAGRPTVEVPAHGSVVSDAVDLAVPALADLAVSLYLPKATLAQTQHTLAQQTSYVSPPGPDATGTAALPVGGEIDSWPFLCAVEVESPGPSATVVAFGDSIADGDGSTPGANRRWPDVLAARLLSAGDALARVAVLNEGIIGNRLLSDSPGATRAEFGEAGLKRFERDVLSQPAVKVVVLRLGGNDIGFPGSFAPKESPVTARAVIDGLKQLVAQAHRHGVQVVGMTLSPNEGAVMPQPGYATPAKDAVREQVNAWMRSSGTFDLVIDADRLLRDPQHPARLAARYDSGDHLHPNDAGYAVIGQAIPLDWLRRATVGATSTGR